MCRSSTTLSYEVSVIPRFNFPAIFLERIIRSDLPVNLRALACRAERNFVGMLKQPVVGSASHGSSYMEFSNPLSETDKLLSKEINETHTSSNFGSLPASSSNKLNSKWGVFGMACRLDRPCIVDEVHLRRFDGLLVIY